MSRTRDSYKKSQVQQVLNFTFFGVELHFLLLNFTFLPLNFTFLLLNFTLIFLKKPLNFTAESVLL